MVMFLGGLLVAAVAIAVSTVMDGNSFGPLIGPSSFVMVFFGTVGGSLMGYGLADIKRIPAALRYAFRATPPDTDAAITQLAGLADVARREGMLALESRLAEIDDPFLRTGLQLVVDGLDADQVSEVLQIELAASDERHQLGISFFKTLGSYAPTFGMLGTVIGLINMLGNLSDPDQLGIGMSLALLTTLYGVLFANLVFLPVASRLERLNSEEMSARDVVMDGILSIQSGVSPRVLVERLETYLPPERRVGLLARQGDTGAAATSITGRAA